MPHPWLYEENSFGVFLLVTLVLGAVIRFFHFALFGGTLLSPHFYAVDTGVALLFGMAGFRVTRARQMARQYGVLGHRP